MPQPSTVVLSLCMIVRDNESILPACLEGIRPWVDEMIVVDTGSTDATPQIAASFGARVEYFDWIDDFSAARNESLRFATGQWIFWMDSDDTIDETNGRKLRELAYGTHKSNTAGYVFQVHCPAEDYEATGDATVVDHVKLFRNHPDIRFEGRIHEQVLMPIRKLGGEVEFTDIHVVHSGADHSPEGRQRKIERDLRILKLDLADRPDHPFVLFNLGMTYADIQEYEEAIHWINRCLKASDPGESHVRKTYAFLAMSLLELDKPEESLAACRRGRQHYPDDPELLFREGIACQRLNRLEEAEKAYRGAMADNGEEYFSSVNRGIAGHKARHNLGLVYASLGRLDLAELQWREALDDAESFEVAAEELQRVLNHREMTNTASVVNGQSLTRLIR